MSNEPKALETHQPFALKIPIYASIGLASIVLCPLAREHAVVMTSILSSSAILMIWALLLWRRTAVNGRTLEAVTAIRKPHYVQALVQFCVFAYWGWYWREVYTFAPMIVAQILFAYAFDSLLSWSRRENWQFGFGPFPIIFSTNLFLWFKPEWFYLQFVMVAVGFLGKEYITWDKAGRRAHIFNPSALALFVFSIVLLVTGRTDISWGLEIATTLANPEHIYLEIFVLGLVVQYLFGVTLTTLGAATALIALNFMYTKVTGVYFFLDSTIPIAVFLGLHLLVTDPATSPRTELGRALFGALYGLGVFVLFGLLEYLGQPSFYDKLLCVPFLNLCIQALDRGASSMSGKIGNIDQLGMGGSPKRRNLVYMAIWIALFASMHFSGLLQKHHPGARAEFWRAACDEQKPNACQRLFTIHRNNCDDGIGSSCNALGLLLNEKGETPEARVAAADGFLRACKLGESAGCKNGLIQYFSNHNTVSAESVETLVQALMQRCVAGDGEACYLAAFGVERNSISVPGETAASLYQTACDGDEARGCSGLARRLARGDDGSPDDTQAAQYFRRACDLDEALSCLQIAIMVRNGQAPPVADDEPVSLLKRACDLGQQDACKAIDKM